MKPWKNDRSANTPERRSRVQQDTYWKGRKKSSEQEWFNALTEAEKEALRKKKIVERSLGARWRAARKRRPTL